MSLRKNIAVHQRLIDGRPVSSERFGVSRWRHCAVMRDLCSGSNYASFRVKARGDSAPDTRCADCMGGFEPFKPSR